MYTVKSKTKRIQRRRTSADFDSNSEGDIREIALIQKNQNRNDLTEEQFEEVFSPPMNTDFDLDYENNTTGKRQKTNHNEQMSQQLGVVDKVNFEDQESGEEDLSDGEEALVYVQDQIEEDYEKGKRTNNVSNAASFSANEITKYFRQNTNHN